MNRQPTDRWDGETTLVVQVSAFAALLSFLYFFRHGDLLLYGDAVAHINIARRVIDSQTPGLLQLGTVWLPLPHLLMVPFLLSDLAWRTGIAGSLSSLVAYVLGTVGIFRLVRSVLTRDARPDSAARIAAWSAAIIYAANPNLLYLQSTAMTESLYLALFIWSIAYFADFVRYAANPRAENQAASSLTRCGLCVAGASLTRYDGWFLAGVLFLAAAFLVLKLRRQNLSRALVKFTLLVAAVPALWITYNGLVYKNPLEFANGPYSARAIAQRSATPTMPSYPGAHDLPTAFSFFLKSGELVLAEGIWGRLWLAGLVAGVIVILVLDRRLWPVLLLLAPVPFYVLSISYGGVPIYVPTWWPFSSYNTRYGLQLLPVFAASMAVALYPLLSRISRMSLKIAVIVAVGLGVAGSYIFVWRAEPVCYREAKINSRTRVAIEAQLASNLLLLPHDATLLMYLGDHVGALQQAGIPLRRVINEGNHRPWQKPSDAEGLWERALAHPQQYADYVVAFEGDPVATHVERGDLQSVVVLHTSGQPACTIYWTRRPPGNHPG